MYSLLTLFHQTSPEEALQTISGHVLQFADRFDELCLSSIPPMPFSSTFLFTETFSIDFLAR
jgi:hypothetical protein